MLALILLSSGIAFANQGDRLLAGQYLTTNQYLVSPNQNYFAIMQADGNFVVYRGSWPGDNKGFVWQTSTNASNGNPSFAIMQGDGNFLIYRGGWPGDNRGMAWSSSTQSIVPHLSPQLRLTNSGTLSIVVNNCEYYQNEPRKTYNSENCIPLENENVALGKPTSQSSTDYGGPSPRAVDGNTNGVWDSGSVTHTGYQSKPWWKVDLKGTYTVTEVNIFNRVDCCTERLSNFNVELLDSNAQVISSQTYAGTAPSQTTFKFPKIKANQVRIQLNGTNYLSLAEVTVKGNLALGRPATQSTTDYGGVAPRAVDGSTNGNWSNISVTHTGYQSQPWWKVDLSQQRPIGEVVIWNRTDCCTDRLANYAVELLDQNGGLVRSIPVASTAQKTSVDFGGKPGKTIKVKLSGSNYLSLAEVEVYEQLLVNPRQVSAGGYHACALGDNGVQCWGDNSYNQLHVPALDNPRQVSTGRYHSCALDNAGVKCWGSNQFGETSVPSLLNPRVISAGWEHTCAIDDTGVRCWGNSESGRTLVPTGLTNPREISAGGYHTCAIDDDGVKCWGAGDERQLQVPGTLINPRHLSAGWQHTCVGDDTGVKCWGSNLGGQAPQSWTLQNAFSIGTGYYHSCALADTGVHCVGENDWGQLNVPTTLSFASQISSGIDFNCALDANGVKCWGRNTKGQINVPAQHIDRYSLTELQTLFDSQNSNSQYFKLQNLLTTLSSSINGLPNITVVKNDSLVAPTFGVSRDETSGQINSVTINTSSTHTPTQHETWYMIGQLTFESILGSHEDEYECISSNEQSRKLFSLNDVFLPVQSEQCLLREAFAQAFTMLTLNTNMDISKIKSLITGNYYPIGVSRSALSTNEGYDDNAHEPLSKIIEHVTRLAFVNKPQIGIMDNTSELEALLRFLYELQPECGRECSHRELTGRLFESSEEYHTLCTIANVGGFYGIKEEFNVSCKKHYQILCRGRNYWGGTSYLKTDTTHELETAQSVCVDEFGSDYEDIEAVNSNEYNTHLAEINQQIPSSHFVGLMPKYDTNCEYMEYDYGNDVYRSDSSFKMSCGTKMRILCVPVSYDAANNETYVDSTLEAKITQAEYPLYDANTACLEEFSADSFNAGDTRIPVVYLAGASSIAIIGGGMVVAHAAHAGPMVGAGAPPVGAFAPNIVRNMALAAANFAAYNGVGLANTAGILSVHSIQIGAGSCHVANCFDVPNNTNDTAFIDCGSSNRNPIAAGAVRPIPLAVAEVEAYLNGFGLRDDHVPTVIVTHPDKDHFYYISHLLPNGGVNPFTPDRIFLGGNDLWDYLPPGHIEKHRFAAWLINNVNNATPINGFGAAPLANHVDLMNHVQHAQWAAAPAIIKNFPACNANLVKWVVNSGNNRNANSAVLELEQHTIHGAKFYSAIFPGDAEAITEADAENAMVLGGYVPATHRVLMSSHHGSELGSNMDPWIAHTEPTHVVYSAGNSYGHPHCDVVDRFQLHLNGLIPPPPLNRNLVCDGNTIRGVANTHRSTNTAGSIVSSVIIPLLPAAAQQHIFISEY